MAVLLGSQIAFEEVIVRKIKDDQTTLPLDTGTNRTFEKMTHSTGKLRSHANH